MPRYIVGAPAQPPHSPAERAQIVESLVRELQGGAGVMQPLIVEESVGTGRYVYVVWDQWEHWPEQDRTDLILEAYDKVEPAMREMLINAVGVTAEQALDLGLLRFRIAPVPKRDHDYDKSRVMATIANEQKHTVLGDHAGELRYASVEEAEQARLRLEREYRDVHWVITEEVGRIGDY